MHMVQEQYCTSTVLGCVLTFALTSTMWHINSFQSRLQATPKQLLYQPSRHLKSTGGALHDLHVISKTHVCHIVCLSKVVIRQGGQGCKVFCRPEVCSCSFQLSQEVPARCKSVWQRGEQQRSANGNLGNGQPYVVRQKYPALLPVLLEKLIVNQGWTS